MLAEMIDSAEIELVHVALLHSWKMLLDIRISAWLIAIPIALFPLFRKGIKRIKLLRGWKTTELEISLGNVGKMKICPDGQDRQIAHRIWTELVTRKAGIEIDLDNDVITEIYDSWYELFRVVRQLVGEICAADIPISSDKRALIDIATRTLNDGLRPHLTRWQARFRSWLESSKNDYKNLSPQEIQRLFPQYEELTKDLLRVNRAIIQYRLELKRMIDH